MNVVANNIPGMFTSRQIGITNRSKVKSMEKLSSGYKINRAADDAAGLTISENMRRMIRGLTQASLNVQDGVSLCQVADGYLDEVHDMLHRLTELSVKGSNGTLTDDDRQAINEEVDALKEEMRRIFNVANFNEIPLFHVPYMPEILSQPTDMEVFHTGTGNVVGGLEFNNVRYSIPELQALGIPIDDNGIATEDLKAGDAIFELWDGEEVDLSIKQGQTIDQAARNYKWTATDEGILINNKLSAEWSEVKGPDGNPLGSTPSTFATGMYSFSHHGMNIEFGIDEEATLEEVMNGINGDAATIPATWDVKVGGTSSKLAADVLSSTNSIKVTNANKNLIDHDYYIMANEQGIAIKRVNPKDPSDTSETSYVSWSSFKDSSVPAVDENGNAINTNGGYPIGNWGTGIDSNNASSIKFDANATYSFTSPDSNMPISFRFKLAESASLDEIISSLNNAKISTEYTVNSQGGLTLNWNGQNAGTIVARPIQATFELQRAYGRDFDNKNSEMTGELTVKRDLKSSSSAENERPDSSGNYSSSSSHSLRQLGISERQIGSDVDDHSGETVSYYAVQSGTDGSGTPVYDYYKTTVFNRTKTWQRSLTMEDTWREEVRYTFAGNLNGKDMDPVVADQTEYYMRHIIQNTNEDRLYAVTNVSKITDPDDVPDEIKNDPTSHIGTYRPEGETETYTSTSPSGVYDIPEGGIGSATLTGVETTTFRNISFRSSGTYNNDAFRFNYNINNISVADQLAKAGGAVNVADVKFTGRGYPDPNRMMYPGDKDFYIREAEFDDITLNAPKKNLIIQAGADKDTTITMEWSALNLTILGISGANTLTQDSSRAAIGMVQKALNVVSETRSLFGAYQNRFEHTIANLDNVVENTQAAESLIRDTDMSSEMVKLAKDNILEQAGTAMLVQSNRSKDWVISLLNS